MKWRRGERLPVDRRPALGLASDDRVLAAAQTVERAWVAATPDALHLPGQRIRWTDVAHVQWDGDSESLAVDPVPGAFQPVRLRLAEPGRLPETVHERVMASIVVTRRVVVPEVGGATVVGRRDGGGALSWQVLPDAGVDPDRLAAATDATVRDLRAELGELRDRR